MQYSALYGAVHKVHKLESESVWYAYRGGWGGGGLEAYANTKTVNHMVLLQHRTASRICDYLPHLASIWCNILCNLLKINTILNNQ